MIKGLHHISMKCNTEEEISKVKEFYICLRPNILSAWHFALALLENRLNSSAKDNKKYLLTLQL